jgi:hypothetical protein
MAEFVTPEASASGSARWPIRLIDRPAERAALIGSHLLGIAVGRYIIGIPPLVNMDDQTLARWLKPVLTHYLSDPAPEH